MHQNYESFFGTPSETTRLKDIAEVLTNKTMPASVKVSVLVHRLEVEREAAWALVGGAE